MRIIYCDSVVDPKKVDPDFEEERATAKTAGLSTSLISYEALADADIDTALKWVKDAKVPETAIYRGWMLSPIQYERLYQGLIAKGLRLVNTPIEYKHCHYLPESYSVIENMTPKSVWLPFEETVDFEAIHEALAQIDSSSVIVKDYVKSEKHDWETACFIPDISDHPAVEKVVSKFLRLRGSYLNEGLVFREFISLEPLTHHSKSGMPLTKEFRLIFLAHQPIAVLNYWDEGDYEGEKPDLAPFLEVAQQVRSNFFTMDVAKTQEGDWIIMELGDAQVAGLPENADKEAYYRCLNS